MSIHFLIVVFFQLFAYIVFAFPSLSNAQKCILTATEQAECRSMENMNSICKVCLGIASQPPKNKSQRSTEELFFCKPGQGKSSMWQCRCDDKRIDTICSTGVCGFLPGHWNHPDLEQISLLLTKKLPERSQISRTDYIGYADGIEWVSNHPKPNLIPSSVSQCLSSSQSKNHKPQYLTKDQLLDRKTAILRGCALEGQLKRIIQNFAFDAPPQFVISKKEKKEDDVTRRSASVIVTIPNSCGKFHHYHQE